MSNTRRATEGGPFHQEKYASSPALEKGLNGVLVKNRCATLSDPGDIELVWFIQWQSMRQGGLEKFTRDLLAAFPERLGTPAMLKIGAKPEAVYYADQVRAVRDEACSPFSREEFPIRGEMLDPLDLIYCGARDDDEEEREEGMRRVREANAFYLQRAEQAAKRHPHSYSVAKFLDICRELFLENVPAVVTKFCLDPACDVSRLRVVTDNFAPLPCFHDLHGALLEYMERWERECLAKIADTAIGKIVLDAMEYAEAECTLVLVEGVYGTGKTFPAQAWCEARPGKRRYVQCPSSNDNLDFFRTMAEPLGVSNAHSMKGQQMRARINDVAQAGHLSIVIDEAHYLFPQASTRVALPGRIN